MPIESAGNASNQPTDWRGRLVLGTGWAIFIGSPGESELHAHHALQLCIAGREPLTLHIEDEPTRRTFAWGVGSDRRHAIDWSGEQGLLLYVERESRTGRALTKALARDLGAFRADASLASVRAAILAVASPTAAHLSVTAASRNALVSLRDECLTLWLPPRDIAPRPPDFRVARTCAAIRSRISSGRIRSAELAQAVELSESRLAALFRNETGIALRRYVLWTRLESAVDALAAGASATTAALEAGFADSAHLARTFRRMFGTSLSRGLAEVEIVRLDA